MAKTDDAQAGSRRMFGPHAAIAVAALVALEILLIAVLFKNAFDFECRAMAPAALCAGLALLPVRAMVAGALAIMALWPDRAALAVQARPAPHGSWIAVNLAGFVAILAPWFFLSDTAGPAIFGLALALWLGGALAASAGALLAAAPAPALAQAAQLGGWRLAAACALGLATPELATLAQNFWKVEALAAVTFEAARALLSLFADDIVSDPSQVLLGVPEFRVLVGPQCSGIEGFALITGFMAFYLWLFRDRLRFPNALALIPVGLALSWALNVVRITVLILIGANVSPDLAVNGFHSHAGWLMFTLLSLSLAAAAHASPWLRRAPAGAAPTSAGPFAPPPPLLQDWNVARLAPFIVFMATALLASTLFEVPAVAYPLRFIAMLAALAAFWPLLARLDWSPHAAPVAAGLAIAVLWIATDAPAAPGGPLETALAAMPAWFFAVWALSRVLGTALLVPVIEELVFRSYLIEKIAPAGRAGGGARLALAVVVSTALFAALHDRWIAAAAAGAVFAACALWRGRIADAVWCHVAANATIAAWALALGRWSVI
ncbi:exosortase E/protease, VPEID-CTERM system [Rubrimonas cliftonensis]|uniref:CAAX prenyl protease 2/Lysostaphin resistance protein A-like domain-containing protein n=1 Tax=Rubrimonas cliftonensis TaxID=89524 RepID=A0A1H3X774_9RHOB|nr:exosortase E/protease, VPEID-CTERM system [Rubrimonas cliftonensis]SDZ95255.1 hypothetical protein SAMN05444370_102306 [Rubrimonas cliftonensis]